MASCLSKSCFLVALVLAASSARASSTEYPVASPQASPSAEAPEQVPPEKPGLAVISFTTEPAGSPVYVNGKKVGRTPCRRALPPGKYEIAFRHGQLEDIVTQTTVTPGEKVQVHGVHGDRAPWKIILSTFLAGGIFTAGGLVSVLIHGETALGSVQLPPDERRFHRNLGIASMAIGVPLLAIATYLAFTGRPGEVRTSIAPELPKRVSLSLLLDAEGTVSGGGLSFHWN